MSFCRTAVSSIGRACHAFKSVEVFSYLLQTASSSFIIHLCGMTAPSSPRGPQGRGPQATKKWKVIKNDVRERMAASSRWKILVVPHLYRAQPLFLPDQNLIISLQTYRPVHKHTVTFLHHPKPSAWWPSSCVEQGLLMVIKQQCWLVHYKTCNLH